MKIFHIQKTSSSSTEKARRRPSRILFNWPKQGIRDIPKATGGIPGKTNTVRGKEKKE